MSDICIKSPTCPLFNDGLLKRQQSADTYKTLFCNVSDNFKNCKRYIVSEKFGICPPYVLPNSSYSIEEIQKRMQAEGLIN